LSSSPTNNLRTVNTLMEYKQSLDECRCQGKIVVVRFFATWCKVREMRVAFSNVCVCVCVISYAYIMGCCVCD
jgi:hypothetical protein